MHAEGNLHISICLQLSVGMGYPSDGKPQYVREEKAMNFTIEQPLLDYVHKKKYAAIVIEPIAPIGCCADMEEILTRFVKEKDIATLINKGYRVLATEPLIILTCGTTLTFDDEVTLGLRRFLGVADIQVTGVSTWKL